MAVPQQPYLPFGHGSPFPPGYNVPQSSDQRAPHDGVHFFPNASGSVFHQSTFVGVEKYTNNTYNNNFPYPNTGSSVIDRLYERSMPSTELNAFDRSQDLPRCLNGTCKILLEAICKWMVGSDDNDPDMLWLYGPAGVGKSALAQTLGEWAEQEGILGAAIFLSDADQRSDLSRLVISIAHQIAKKDAQYSVRVAEKLVADVGLLRKDLRTQFQKLIVEPLSGLASMKRKLVIIIDGLDESRGEREQREVLERIGQALASPQPLPLRWMICSRPEPHIRKAIVNEFRAYCKVKDVPMDKDDIRVYIGEGFRKIIRTYDDAFSPGEQWPGPDAVRIIVDASSGLFIYASTIIKFIEDPDDPTPKEHLSTVLKFIKDGTAHTNPLKALDALYLQILFRVNAKHLSTALHLLGTCAFHLQLPALELANLLNVSQERFYATLQRVHSVVHVPSRERAPIDHLRFFHSSFIEFLRAPTCSGKFSLNVRNIRFDFAEACFRALGKTKLAYAKNLAWKPLKPSSLSLADQMFTYAATHVWSACTSIEDLGDHPLFETILDFNFSRLRFVEGEIPALQLRHFVRWLGKQVERSEKNSRRNIIQWGEVKTPLFTSREAGEKDRCFKIGEGSKAVMVHITSDLVILSR